MRPALLIPLVVISVTASCSTGPAPDAQQTAAVARWTDTVSGGATVPELAQDPETGMLIELQSAPTDPALPDTSAVLALDPATGRQVWSTLTGNEEPTSIMVYKGLLAIATTSSADNAPSVWVLDARSGTEEQSIDLTGNTQVAGLTDNSIIATDIGDNSDSGGSVSAYSLLTGREIWQRSAFDGCPVSDAATGSTVVAVSVNCPGNKVMLVGADPASGRELWSRLVARSFSEEGFGQPFTPIQSVTLTAGGRVFGVSSGEAISLYTDAGRLLDSEPAQYGQSWFTSVGSQALLVYQSPSGYLTVKKIDIATRTTRTLLREPYVLDSAAFAAGVAYIDATAPAPLLPTLLIALNEGTGSLSVSALPFTGQIETYSLATTPDELVLIPSPPGPSMVTAYRFPPPGRTAVPRIQGAAPGRWPTACSLVRTSTIARLAGGSYMAVPRTLPGGADWPDASTCEFIPYRKGLPLVTVSVAWRAPGSAQANQLLRNATVGWTRLTGMRDAAYQNPAYQSNGTNAGDVLMRIGSTIVEIKVSWTPRAIDALADSVARQVEAGI